MGPSVILQRHPLISSKPQSRQVALLATVLVPLVDRPGAARACTRISAPAGKASKDVEAADDCKFSDSPASS